MVGDGFGGDGGVLRVAFGDALEELVGLGELSAIIAIVGFSAGGSGIQQTGLDARKSGCVADFGGGDADRSGDGPIADHRRKRKLQCRIISREPFDQIGRLAARHGIAPVIEPRFAVAAVHGANAADGIDGGVRFGVTAQRAAF